MRFVEILDRYVTTGVLVRVIVLMVLSWLKIVFVETPLGPFGVD